MIRLFFSVILFIAFTFAESPLHERYHTYEEIQEQLFAWNDDFGVGSDPPVLYSNSGIIYHLEEIGRSTNDDLPFWGVRLSYNADQREDEPRTLFLGQCHAEEIYGVEITMRIIEMFLNPQNYQQWYFNMQHILSTSEVWIVPTHNPEGLRVVHGYLEGENWLQDVSYRKNKRDVDLDGMFDFNVGIGNDSDGVDLNRNYDFNWVFGDDAWIYDNTPGEYQSHYDYYKGDYPWSELEIQSIRDFAFRENFLLSIAYHSSRSGNVSEKVIYSWNWEDEKPSPDFEIINVLGMDIASFVLREDGGGGYLPVSSGSRKGNAHDWFYTQTGCIQYLVEAGTQNIQPDSLELIEYTVDQNIKGAFHLMNKSTAYQSGDLAANAYQVTGLVKNANTQEPIEDAIISIHELNGSVLNARKTDEFGRFRRLLSPGTFNIEVRASGYESQIQSHVPSSALVTYENFELSPLTGHSLDIYPIVPADYTEQILLDITDVHGTNQIELYPNEITSVELFEGMYRLKCTGTGLFTQFFEIDHYSPSELTIEMTYELSVFSDDFYSLDNWEIESGSWQNDHAALTSQFRFTYDPGYQARVFTTAPILIQNSGPLNLSAELQYEMEWDYDSAFVHVSDENNQSEITLTNQHWDQHKIEFPLFHSEENSNLTIAIELSADSTVAYRGLKIHNIEITSGENFTCYNGDINQDGEADILDVLLQIQSVTNLVQFDPIQQCYGDIDQNGDIDIYDIILLRTTLIGNE